MKIKQDMCLVIGYIMGRDLELPAFIDEAMVRVLEEDYQDETEWDLSRGGVQPTHKHTLHDIAPISTESLDAAAYNEDEEVGDTEEEAEEETEDSEPEEAEEPEEDDPDEPEEEAIKSGVATIEQVAKRIGKSDATVYNRIKAGTFPPADGRDGLRKTWSVEVLQSWEDGNWEPQDEAEAEEPKKKDSKPATVVSKPAAEKPAPPPPRPKDNPNEYIGERTDKTLAIGDLMDIRKMIDNGDALPQIGKRYGVAAYVIEEFLEKHQYVKTKVLEAGRAFGSTQPRF